MMTARRVTSRRPAVSARAAFGLALFGIAAGAIIAFDLEALLPPTVHVFPGAALVVPVVMYAMAAAVWFGRRSAAHVASAAAILIGGHWALVAIAAAAEAFIAGSAYVPAVAHVGWGMPLLTLVQVVLVPWALVPVCRVLMPAPRMLRVSRPASHVRPYMRDVAVTRPVTSSAQQEDEKLSGATTLPDPGHSGPAPSTASSEMTPERAVPPVVEEPARTAPRSPSAERVEEVVRVGFAKIAAQLPAAAFLLPLDRVGANLLEPDHLLVPQRLVAPQLPEGVVRVAWDVVADQFPRQALAMPDGEIARRLPNGCLVLPLDEIVRQLPPALFVLSSPVADIRGIEDFPLPFQPHVPTMGEEASEGNPPVEAEALAPTLTTPSATPPAAEVRLEVENVSEPIPEPVMGLRAPAPESDIAPSVLQGEPIEPASSFDVRGPASEPPLLSGNPEQPVSERYRVESAPTSASDRFVSSSYVERIPIREPVERAHAKPFNVAEVSAQLTPLLGAVEVDQRHQSGLTLVTVVAPGVDGEAAIATAAPMLSFVADPRLPATMSQATIRATTGSLVLTPVGHGDRRGTVLVAAVAPGAPLAMVERALLRVVGEDEHHDAVPAEVRGVGRFVDSDLRAAAVPQNVRAVAESLRAFGRVTPAMLRDPAGTLLMYLFLPQDVDPRLMAGFARDLRRHFEAAPLGAVSSIIARVGAHRLVVWELDAGRSCASILVAYGPVDRPGLARIELERAALRLAAL
jgi:hypothetical protein